MCNLVLILFWLANGTAHAEENITLNTMCKIPSTKVLHIGPNCVAVPTGNLLLARKASTVCAVKLAKVWKDGSDEFAEYESYYKADTSGHFQKETVKVINAQLSFPEPRGIGRFAFSFGNKDIDFGAFKLAWLGGNCIYFHNTNQRQGDHGIEIAPTVWTNILDVNAFDSRLKWFRYDDTRKDIIIPIDKYWR